MTMSEDHLIIACPQKQLPSVFRCRVPGFYCFLRQHCPPWAGRRGWCCLNWEGYSSASSIHQPVGSRSHPPDREPLTSHRLLPGSPDPKFSSPLHSMCWVAAQATRQACCVENLARHPNAKKKSEALGNPAREGSSKEAKALRVGEIAEIACIGS